jgi:hypothetical protein
LAIDIPETGGERSARMVTENCWTNTITYMKICSTLDNHIPANGKMASERMVKESHTISTAKSSTTASGKMASATAMEGSTIAMGRWYTKGFGKMVTDTTTKKAMKN